MTLSSAEADLIALVKCSAELMGMRSAMRDWGVESSGVVYADSSAALAIANRKGARKLRHINIMEAGPPPAGDEEGSGH